MNASDECVQNWSKKKGINKLELAKRKSSVTRLLEERIGNFTDKYINIRPSSTTLKNDIVERSADSLHDNFVIRPID